MSYEYMLHVHTMTSWMSNKLKATSLPPHTWYDCAFDLIPGSTPPRGSLYSLSGPESRAMQKHISESLQAGVIRPSLQLVQVSFLWTRRLAR